MLPQPAIPGETLKKLVMDNASIEKNPSDATNKRYSEFFKSQTSAPASTLSLLHPLRSARPLQQRAGSKYFSDSFLQVAGL